MPEPHRRTSDRRAIVIGGSLGGLFAATLLTRIGWSVDVYERSPGHLESRGGGIVLQPEVESAFQRAGVVYRAPLGVVATERLFLDEHGEVIHAVAMRQTLTSWGMLFGSMQRIFPSERYHTGSRLVDLAQGEDSVTAVFANGHRETADLLVAADGPSSTVRQLVFADARPNYAGYVGYRGLVAEDTLARKAADIFTERFVFQQFPNSHILQYLVPGDDESLEPGRRRFNWVWYVNYDKATELPYVLTDKQGQRHASSIPPGEMHPDAEHAMRTYAGKVLAPPFQQLVAATNQPFVQSILDYGAPTMVVGRVALVGDAAFIPRPHTAASTSKAAANAIGLADALMAHNHDVTKALEIWEPEQVALGRRLLEIGQTLGTRSQFVYGSGRYLDGITGQ